MPKVPYPYDVNGKLVTGNGCLIPICFLSNRSVSARLLLILFDSIYEGYNPYAIVTHSWF